MHLEPFAIYVKSEYFQRCIVLTFDLIGDSITELIHLRGKAWFLENVQGIFEKQPDVTLMPSKK
jgi:hypothetical protein